MQFTPRPWQLPAIDHLLNKNRACLWLPMGGGKSSAVLTAAVQLADVMGDVFPMLIIAPKRVATTTWPDEVKEWEHTRHLKVNVITGTAAQRLGAFRSKADIYTIAIDNLPWLLEQCQQNSKGNPVWPFRSIVVDEASKLKGFRAKQGSKRAKALAKVAFCSQYFWELSGTPNPNGLQDIWGQLWFMDKGERLGKSFTAFAEQYFSYIQVGDSMLARKLVPVKGSQERIEAAIKDVALSIRLEDYLDIRKPVRNQISYDLPPAARNVYMQMEKEFFAELAAGSVEAVNAGAKSMKLRQIASGFAYTDGVSWQPVHDEMRAALESVLAEWSEPVLVAYYFKPTLKRLKEWFPQGRELDQNPQTIRDWNNGDIPLLFAHPASAGHGLSLQHGGRVIVHTELDWNLENYKQINERLGPTRQMQSGYDRLVYEYVLTAHKTVHDQIRHVLDEKGDMMEAFLQAMNGK